MGRINGKYATLDNSPIQFIHDSVKFLDLCALYAIADVGLVTPARRWHEPRREGVSRLPAREHAGVLILSEFAGAAEELFNAVVVNPYDTQAVAARALPQALALPEGEKTGAQSSPMRERVMKHGCPTLGTLIHRRALAALDLARVAKGRWTSRSANCAAD